MNRSLGSQASIELPFTVDEVERPLLALGNRGQLRKNALGHDGRIGEPSHVLSESDQALERCRSGGRGYRLACVVYHGAMRASIDRLIRLRSTGCQR
jgi:hypothetical protein